MKETIKVSGEGALGIVHEMHDLMMRTNASLQDLQTSAQQLVESGQHGFCEQGKKLKQVMGIPDEKYVHIDLQYFVALGIAVCCVHDKEDVECDMMSDKIAYVQKAFDPRQQ